MGTPQPSVLHQQEHAPESSQHPQTILQTTPRTRRSPPHFRFHDMRHTFATLMLSNNEHAKVVQEMLGHATINITLDTYSHVLPDMQEQAMNRLGALL